MRSIKIKDGMRLQLLNDEQYNIKHGMRPQLLNDEQYKNKRRHEAATAQQ
jgi:hypothetical protein